MRGAIFETWVASEVFKARVHRGLQPGLFFFRDRRGSEVDLILDVHPSYVAVETKSGQTIADDFFAGLHVFEQAVGTVHPQRKLRKIVVYGGDATQRRTAGTVLPWSEIDRNTW